MAFGIGKAFKKGWKKALGWADDDWAKQAAITAGVGAATGGWVGAAVGALMGGLQGYQAQQQEKAIKAQIASAEKIAAMQNSTAVVSAAPIPTQTVEKAIVSEQNDATRKARAFRLANSVRSSTLGGGSSNSGKKKVLG